MSNRDLIQIERHGDTRDEYIDFVADGLENMRADSIEKIDVFNRQISVTFKRDAPPTKVVQATEYFVTSGLKPFVSLGDAKAGNEASFKLRD